MNMIGFGIKMKVENGVEEGRLMYINQNWSINLFDPISMYVQSANYVTKVT